MKLPGKTEGFLAALLCLFLSAGVSADTLEGRFNGVLVELQSRRGSFSFVLEDWGGTLRTVSLAEPFSPDMENGSILRLYGESLPDTFLVRSFAISNDRPGYTKAIPGYATIAACMRPDDMPWEEEEPVQYGTSGMVANLVQDVPALSSRPSATAKIFLDFDGHPSIYWFGYLTTVTPRYDIDNDTSGFSSTELSNIEDIWKRVAQKYAPFDIDVTTIEPPNFDANSAVRVVIGGAGDWYPSGPLGIALLDAFNTFYLPREVFVFPKRFGNNVTKYLAESIAHEVGHTFGLNHQTVYPLVTGTCDAGPNQYNPGTSEKAPIMGNSFYSDRGLWSDGHVDCDIETQDDMAIIASSGNNFGYAPDDHADVIGDATDLGGAAVVLRADGVLERTSDIDCFRFVTGSGTATVQVFPLTPGPTNNVILAIYDENGTTVAFDDQEPGLFASVSFGAALGPYYGCVASQGEYGDVGQYQFSAIIPLSGTPTVTPTPTASNTPTATQTPLATSTFTPTATPSNTSTHTPAPTPSHTATSPPQSTATPSSTPTASPSSTATATPVPPGTSSPLPTATNTPVGPPGLQGDVLFVSPRNGAVFTGREKVKIKMTYAGEIRSVEIRLNKKPVVKKSFPVKALTVDLRKTAAAKVKVSVKAIFTNGRIVKRSLTLKIRRGQSRRRTR